MPFVSPAAEHMSSPIVTVPADARATEAEAILQRHGVTALGVTDGGGALVGVISRTDLLDAAEGEAGETFSLPDLPVHELMSLDPVTVDAGTPLRDVAATMLAERIHRVFVTDDGVPRGVLSTRDVMGAVAAASLEGTVDDIATPDVVTIAPDDTIAAAVETLAEADVHGLIVVDDSGPVGSFSQLDALLARAHDPRTAVEDVMDVRVLAVPPGTSLRRAARRALAMHVRRLVIVRAAGAGSDRVEVVGIVSSLDFCRAAAG